MAHPATTQKRRQKPKWLICCSWEHQQHELMLVPASNGHRVLEGLLESREEALIVWRVVKPKEGTEAVLVTIENSAATQETLSALPSLDAAMWKTMKCLHKKRVVWKQM
jgi:hypothetical protein